jgi:hypothetical protein
MVDRNHQTRSRLPRHAALRVQAERLIAAYVAPESDRGTIINGLIALFDAPAQREAERLAEEALGEAPDSINSVRRSAAGLALDPACLQTSGDAPP